MLAMGLALPASAMIQPLKNVRLVILALLANFVLVPLLGVIIIRLIPLEEPLQIGLILLATAAGAPFIPKLVQGAKGNVGAAVGLMFLIMVVTIFYLPLVLPLLLPGVEVDPLEIAKSLIVSMLIPLLIAMLIRSLIAGLHQVRHGASRLAGLQEMPGDLGNLIRRLPLCQ